MVTHSDIHYDEQNKSEGEYSDLDLREFIATEKDDLSISGENKKNKKKKYSNNAYIDAAKREIRKSGGTLFFE